MHQIGKYQRISSDFNYFLTELVRTSFLKPGHLLICDNASIHRTAENRNLAEVLRKEKIFGITFTSLLPKVESIELVLQLLGHRLRDSNVRHWSHQMKSEDIFLWACVRVLHPFFLACT